MQRNLGCRATYVITHLDEGFVEVVAAGYCRPIVQVTRVPGSWVCWRWMRGWRGDGQAGAGMAVLAVLLVAGEATAGAVLADGVV